MQADFWNERYKEDGFAYGTKPNDFLKEQTFEPNSKILCLAEGEGRNAIFLASQGHIVKAVDISEEGIIKLRTQANEKGLSIETVCADLLDYSFEPESWDAIVVIFGHFPPDIRKRVHGKLFAALKKGGKVILEAYSKMQLVFKTGGPKDEKLLYSTDELLEDFEQFGDIMIEQKEREIHEGKYHNGNSSVIQLVAVKN